MFSFHCHGTLGALGNELTDYLVSVTRAPFFQLSVESNSAIALVLHCYAL